VTGTDSPGGETAVRARAVFLSYASEDAVAAERLCAALRAAGVEVWFDRSELRGGDAWDRQIRQHIRDCALFVPVISAATEARAEGYFRREWRLAVDRTHDMAEDVPYLVPVALGPIDAARARVPDAFRALQWTPLPDGEATPEFVARIQHLLAGGRAAARPATPAARAAAVRRSPAMRWGLALAASASLSGIAYLVHERTGAPSAAAPAPAATAPVAATAPPPHSVAVLPFANLSGDPQQEYFSDGLSEEILNDLARVEALHVAARTSSFAFRGTQVDLGAVARRLNVGTILEGSVRRDGRRVRVTTRLVNATTGFQLWSHAYDEDVKDVLSVQASIAATVARELDVALSGNQLARLGLGGTHDPAALDAYLRGSHLMAKAADVPAWTRAVAEFDEAIRHDPRFAAAYMLRAIELTDISVSTDDDALRAATRPRAQESAERAIALAPDLGEAYAARGFVRNVALLDFGTADDFRRALKLAPGSALVQGRYASYAAFVGDFEASTTALQRALELDPENASLIWNRALHLMSMRRWDEARAAIEAGRRSVPTAEWDALSLELALASGDYATAATQCEAARAGPTRTACLAVAYHGLGRTADAEAQLDLLREHDATGRPVLMAQVYADWGNPSEAVRWLNVALKTREPMLQTLRTSTSFYALRDDPRFQAVEAALHMPPRPGSRAPGAT